MLDLTRVLAGPTCARTLAEHGADVMKISAAHLPNLGYQEWDTGHGKLSAQLDLRQPGDLETLRGLVRQADVFSQGYRPGSLGGRGLAPEELAALRPGLVYVSLSAFGHSGPWAARRGFDTVVQTVSGMTTRQAEIVPGKTEGPQFYPVSAIDYCTGYLMAFGAMVALARRAEQGGSWLVRISLAQVGKWMTDLGEVPAAALAQVPDEFSAAELESWSMVSQTPSGPLRHLKPVVQLSETQPSGRGRRCRSAIIARSGRRAERREGEFPHFPQFPLPVLARRKTLVAETLVAGGRCAKKVERWA